MSTETVGNGNAGNAGAARELDSLVYVDPAELVTDGEIDVRFGNLLAETDEEVEAIQNLAESMLAGGQIEPVRVREGVDGRLHLIAGNRRRRAALLIRELDPSFMLAAVVAPGSVDGKLALQQAAHENIKRKGLSAIQLMLLIAKVRSEFGWTGKAGTAEVAKWLGVSTATVTQTEKLAKLEPQFQLKVHEGTLSMDAALKLLKVEPDKREAELKAAEQRQRDEERAAEEAKKSKPAAKKAASSTTAAGKPAAKARTRKTGKVQKKHIRADGPETKSRKEVVDYFAVVRDSPAYGYENGAVRTFAAAFVGWAAGTVGERKLDALFDEMVKSAAKGTPTVTKTEGPVSKNVATAAKKKSAARSAKKK